MPHKEEPTREVYNPTPEVVEVRSEDYRYVYDMICTRNQSYREFNDRTLKTFIDDSEKRLNAYVPDKDTYDPPKDTWQANVALPTIRNKMERMLAGFSLKVPDLDMKAFGENNNLDIDRAENAKWLIKGSYLEVENPVLTSFWEAWETAGRGTGVVYEGYLKTKYKQKFIKSYDIVTGEIESEEREVNVDDKCLSMIVPLTELFIWDFYIYDIQEQPRVAWIKYYDRDVFMREFEKYKDAKFVQTSAELVQQDETATFYYQKEWATRERAGTDKIEVIRLYDKVYDTYRIYANGVLLLDAPLLWTVNGEKVLPFAKTVHKPFVNKNFFYGNSMPNIMMGEYDIRNTVWNSVMDKEFRNLEKPFLVGVANRDALELEDEWITGDRKIYVNDINQVKELEVGSVDQSDIAMLELLAKGLEDDAPALPDATSNNPTAREIVIADERLQEMKGQFQEMMSDLWRQKYYLRLANIQLNYPQPRMIVDKSGKETKLFRTFIIDNAILDRATGEKGILAIQFRDVKGEEKQRLATEIASEEAVMKKQGINYKKLVVGTQYFDNYTFRLEVVPESLKKLSLARMQATILEELEVVAKLFPQVFVANQDEYFSDLAKSYDRNPAPFLDKINNLKQQAQEQAQQQPQGQPQVPQTTGGQQQAPTL